MAVNPEISLDAADPAKRRRKRSKWRWVLLTLASAVGAAIAAGNLAQDASMAFLTFNGVLALAPALWLTVPIFQGISPPDPKVEPLPLERWMPLHGRWLRILLAAPGMLIALAMFWAVLFTLLLLAEALIGLLIYYIAVRFQPQ